MFSHTSRDGDVVRVSGVTTFDAIDAERFDVSGATTVNGDVRADDVSVSGAANVDGDLALPRNLFRELNALRACEGPHVVRLREAFATGRSLAMVLEHCDTDLRTVLERHASPVDAR